MYNYQDLELLLRTGGGDVRMVVHCHIFDQSKLGDGEHRFLFDHIEALTVGDIARWLVFSPPRAQEAVRALVDRLAKAGNPGQEVVWSLRPLAGDMEPEVLDDLVDRLRHLDDRLEPHIWQHLACQLRGMCPTFAAVARTEGAGPLALVLFDQRRDELACRARLLETLRRDSHELRTMEILKKIGFPRGDDIVPHVVLGTVTPEDPVRARASLLAWLEDHKLLHIIPPEDALPERVVFPTERESYSFGPSPERYLLELSLRWPGDDGPRSRGWYVRQFYGAASRGAAWGNLVVELMGSQTPGLQTLARGHAGGDVDLGLRILNEIAWMSMEGPVVAPWLGASILAALERHEPDAWGRAARYLDHRDWYARGVDREDVAWMRHYLYRGSISGVAFVLSPEGVPSTILLQAPAPEDAGDEFDDLILRHRHILDDDEHFGAQLASQALFRRLAALPVTSRRADRLVAMMVDHPELFQNASADDLQRLASAAQSVSPDRLPAIEVVAPYPSRDLGDRIAAYRRLGGAVADERVRDWMRAALEVPCGGDSGDPEWERTFTLAARLAAAPDLASRECVRALEAAADQLSVPSLVTLHRVVPAFITEARLVAAAEARVAAPLPQWAYGESADLPDSLAPAVRLRMRIVAREDEFLALARWLVARGERSDTLIGMFLPRLAQGAPGWQARQWLGSLLSSRSAWERLGPRVVEVAVAGEAWGFIEAIAEQSVRSATELNADPPHGLVGAIHEALAVVLIRRARCALDDGNEAAAVASLQALAALSPPSRFSRKLVRLSQSESLSKDVRDMIELNVRLHRHGTNRDASLSQVGSALALLREGTAVTS
jgi:hypothetical protein